MCLLGIVCNGVALLSLVRPAPFQQIGLRSAAVQACFYLVAPPNSIRKVASARKKGEREMGGSERQFSPLLHLLTLKNGAG